MGRRAWTFAASLVVLGAAVCWWLQRAHDPSLPDAPFTPVAAAASSPLAAAASGDRTVERAVDAPARVEPVAPAPEGSVQVRVLGVDGAPVAGAVVHYGDPREMSSTDRLHRFDVEQMLKDRGAQRRTNGEGIARWPAQPQEKRHWLVVARADEQFGELWIARDAPASDVHVLQLRADVRALVRVLDTQHQPVADVPVCAAYPGKGDRPYTGHQSLGISDAAGEVVLHHMQLWSEQVEPRGTVLPAMLGFDMPGVSPAHEIDAARPPAEPIVLFLSPTGAIDVIAMDAYGKPRRGEPFALRRDGVAGDEPGFEATTDETGTAVFPWVGLGHSFRVGGAHVPAAQWRTVVGPRAPHERVTVRFQQAAGPTLTGRLLRDGAPLAHAQLALTIGGDPAGIGSLATDGQGRFRVALVSMWVDRVVDEVGFAAVGSDARAPGDNGTWRGNLRLSVGEHDLGDVVVAPLPVIVDGMLVAANGAPLPDARVAVQAKAPASPTWDWSVVPLRQAADGAFVAYGDRPPGDLRLVVHGVGFAPVPPLPFAAGARGVRIELRRGGSMRASVKVGSQLAAACLEPLLVPQDGAPADSVLRPFTPTLDPRLPAERGFVRDEPLTVAFTWPAVRPGRHRLELRSRCLPRPLAVIDDVIVADGERTNDARLADIDCTGLHAIELRIPQADKHIVDRTCGAGVAAVLQGDVPGERFFQIDGELVFFAADGPIDVLVRVNGCRDRVLRGVTASTTVELDPGIAVELAADQQADAGVSFVWTLTALDDPLVAAAATIWSPAMGGSTPRLFYETPELRARGEEPGPTLVPRPGRYRVGVWRVAAGVATAQQCEPGAIDVPERGGRFVVRVH